MANLLTGDTATFTAGIGTWNKSAGNASFTLAHDTAEGGVLSMAVTATATNVAAASHAAGDTKPAVTAGATVTCSIDAKQLSGTARTGTLRADFYDATNATVSVNVQAATAILTVGSYTTLTGPLTVPAGAVSMRISLRVSGSPVAGETFYLDNAVIDDGAGATVTGTGALAATAATLSGTGTLTVTGTGATAAAAAALAASGAVIVTGVGGVASASATLGGAASVTVTGGGTLTAAPAGLTGSATVGSTITGTGALAAPAAGLTAGGTLTLTGAGTLAAQAATLAGAALATVTGSGALGAGAALLLGAGTVGAQVSPRDITLSIGPGRSRSATASGRSRTLTADPRE